MAFPSDRRLIAANAAPSSSELSLISPKQSGNFSGQLGVKSNKILGQRLVAFLEGRYADNVAKRVAQCAGVSPATVAKWLDRGSLPGFLALLRLIDAYGPEFLVAVYPNAPLWLKKAAREQRAAAIDNEIAKLTAQKSSL